MQVTNTTYEIVRLDRELDDERWTPGDKILQRRTIVKATFIIAGFLFLATMALIENLL